ncbi:exonuclease SbcCD subunit D [Muricomes intestini]|jgi:exonuclease SbcD|uniref:Nuclease SbcCD subunit D n=2 Tax=Muricomes intestini TaxID=1796634 RepID=A0A4R3K721_9FIRM|nr:exonuclease SbcCD subunit D [Muricomes intestini]TCS78481.1 exodeoxyribonuclease I subunit D [Muricomes intestini]HAX51832.1 exonuclease sbcCD subunit D [Lachnospiraceae bacterium]HCR83912.1 exonuclease sbcCD subunit D [Lachnospiraceae bacterium]
MRFFHLSDLHIGRRLHYYNLLEDQRYILNEVAGYVEQMHPDAVVIAGDIYDKAVPSAEAVSLFDDFLTKLADIAPYAAVLIISGNHDSSQRLDYASRLLGRQNIYIAGEPPAEKEDHLKIVTLSDEYGEVNFYLLPFLKPGYVRNVFEKEAPENYSEAVARILEREEIDCTKRNVLVSHQFYTGNGDIPDTCDSEMFSVGGIDNVDIRPLLQFDYAALGHIHRAQQVGKPFIRYCGTLLKYSVSEAEHNKTLHMVELKGKGTEIHVELLPLHPLRNVCRVRGEMDEILKNAKLEDKDDYVSITLTDEIEPYRPKEQLEKVYSHILEIRMDNTRTRKRLGEFDMKTEITDPLTLFNDFFREIQGREISGKERDILEQVLDRAKGE